MGPDKTWELLVAAATETVNLLDKSGDPDLDAVSFTASDMADLVLALDGWAKRGGFPPKPFRTNGQLPEPSSSDTDG